ncbi:hypothetical protein DM01DRAFT_1310390 [Hesseltinella vesiculosa]|uniref:Uncharacterized protein n=1 Tax=Hesseltinella vesiculosa TaxID=101127 RepID=A0A1X2G862_9FUNG|nr:hypothetical protein DM01DRAFT_1310390 [Hesseltinella vesiculosa]
MSDVSLDLHSVTYVDNVNSNLVCCICQYPFVDPVVTSCGHTFCRHCIYQAVESSPLCPVDRSPIDLNDIQEAVKIVSNMVNELQIYCPRQPRGCEYHVQRQHMEHHLASECQYAFEPCQLKECQELVLKKDLQRHADTCQHRETECKMCKRKMPAFELEDHHQLCPSEVMDCPHCGTSRPRSEHTAHLPDCPKMRVTCPFAEFGCDWNEERAKLAAHKEACVYDKIQGFLRTQQLKDDTMQEEIRQLRKENESLRRWQHEMQHQHDRTLGQLGVLFPAHFALDPDLPLETQQQVVLSETERLQGDVDQLSASVASLELKQNMALMTETFRLQEEMQSLRAVCHGMRMQIHYLMMERRGSMAAASPSNGPPPPPPLTIEQETRRRSWLDPSGPRQDTKL